MQNQRLSFTQGTFIELDARSSILSDVQSGDIDFGGLTLEETPALGAEAGNGEEQGAGWKTGGLAMADTAQSGPLLSKRRQENKKAKIDTVEYEPPKFKIPGTKQAAPGAVESGEESDRSEQGKRLLNLRRRSSNLPRPRLTRAAGGAVAGGPGQQALTAELKTLDFFIERGFAKSASALLDELEKRYPNNEALRLRRQRINAMQK